MSADGPLTFLFAPPDARTPHSAAKVHMRRLYDILQLCIARGDLPRARRAWAILARCHGFDWKQLWRTGVHLIDPGDTVEGGEGDQAERVEFLRSVLQQHPEEVRPAVMRARVSRAQRRRIPRASLFCASLSFG
jgi:RNA polymerase I-specific transcription initiation factor RRN11